MICRQCGTDFSDDLFMCPICLTPTARRNPWLEAFPTADAPPPSSNPWSGYEVEEATAAPITPASYWDEPTGEAGELDLFRSEPADRRADYVEEQKSEESAASTWSTLFGSDMPDLKQVEAALRLLQGGPEADFPTPPAPAAPPTPPTPPSLPTPPPSPSSPPPPSWLFQDDRPAGDPPRAAFVAEPASASPQSDWFLEPSPVSLPPDRGIAEPPISDRWTPAAPVTDFPADLWVQEPPLAQPPLAPEPPAADWLLDRASADHPAEPWSPSVLADLPADLWVEEAVPGLAAAPTMPQPQPPAVEAPLVWEPEPPAPPVPEAAPPLAPGLWDQEPPVPAPLLDSLYRAPTPPEPEERPVAPPEPDDEEAEEDEAVIRVERFSDVSSGVSQRERIAIIVLAMIAAILILGVVLALLIVLR